MGRISFTHPVIAEGSLYRFAWPVFTDVCLQFWSDWHPSSFLKVKCVCFCFHYQKYTKIGWGAVFRKKCKRKVNSQMFKAVYPLYEHGVKWLVPGLLHLDHLERFPMTFLWYKCGRKLCLFPFSQENSMTLKSIRGTPRLNFCYGVLLRTPICAPKPKDFV